MDTARRKFWRIAAALSLLPAISLPLNAATPDLGRPLDWPLPSRVPLAAYEARLFAFLNARGYLTLGWRQDKGVRDTGPYIGGKSFGTHPAVRVFYSPGVVRWLLDGRTGSIPDGEMIIKEQYPAPSVRHEGKGEAELWDSLESWTVMVKDTSGSRDGWFWSNPAKGQCVVDNHRDPFPHPISGFGHYCLRCHAVPTSPGTTSEYTFASLRNIAGFPGEPIRFRVDDSWRKDIAAAPKLDPHSRCVRPDVTVRPDRPVNRSFVDFFSSIASGKLSAVEHLPPATHDWVPIRTGTQEFVTSNQCMGCHSGLMAPFGPSMFLPAGASAEYGARGRDVSPHGEWRWTPMGLAGRDPVFLAQVETEIRSIREDFQSDPKLSEALSRTLAETCLRCHGAMGKRQFDSDHAKARFSLDNILKVAPEGEHPGSGEAKYGALARDGVGCTVCHRMQPPVQPPGDTRPELQHFLESSITGRFTLGQPGEIYGPYRDGEISPYAMEHATGYKPKGSAFLRSSRLCASCHMVSLPNVDMPLASANHSDELERIETVPLFKKFHHHVEQATYLEWLNSEYENEFKADNPRGRSCQDCHMDAGLKDDRLGIDVPRIRTRIAAMQDTTYPDGENLAPRAALDVRVRDDYRRHNFSGLNVFLVELFRQFDEVLGVPKLDVMTGSTEGAGDAIADMARRAREDVASIDLKAEWSGPESLQARVVVRNKAGHRFPTGVGFRRAFLELSVYRATDEEPIWSSGRTNELGVLLGADGMPLPSEAFANDTTGRQQYQQHHETITSPDQVQVYETLLQDAKGRFTTSFVRGCKAVKDNRLLPRGWRSEGPGPGLTGRLLRATHPGKDAAQDPRYTDGSGSDEVIYRIVLPTGLKAPRLHVRATLYYQALPPYFLRNLFEIAPDGPAALRLHELCGRVDLKGTPIEGWKLRIATGEQALGPRPLIDPDVYLGRRPTIRR